MANDRQIATDLVARLALMATHSDAQRTAFLKGFNQQPLPDHASEKMRRNYQLGKEAFDFIRIAKSTPDA